MSRGRNYTESERALIIIGVIAGVPIEEIDRALNKSQDKVGTNHRNLSPISHGMLKTIYIPIMSKLTQGSDNNQKRQQFFRHLWEHCLSPQSVEKLLKANEK